MLVAVLGAMAMVFFGALTGHEALSHVNLEVILLLAGMMSLANMIAKTGAFDWAAIKGAQLVGGNGFLTLCLMCLLTAVASAFLDNVTVVVLAVPITLSLCRTLSINPVPFLLAQVFASNIGGVSTILADPPNIIIASEADIGFVDFMLNAAPVSLISMLVLLAVLYLWFRNRVTTTAESREAVMRQDANSAIADRGLLIKCSIVFGFTVVGTCDGRRPGRQRDDYRRVGKRNRRQSCPRRRISHKLRAIPAIRRGHQCSDADGLHCIPVAAVLSIVPFTDVKQAKPIDLGISRTLHFVCLILA